MATSSPRLTALASCAGCAGKAGAALLSDVLARFPDLRAGAPELLVGLEAPDDAAVYRLNDEQAIVATVDFFGPLVDDPYDYGAIAAANALSDVYAMGADVLLALNVSAFPDDLPVDTVARILRGGADKVAEAGAIIAGGHTIRDAEPKYGLCVLGVVHPERILTKSGARPGDVLFLTKPLGTGIVATAAMRDEASADHLTAAVASMTRLSRQASEIARKSGVHAMTDVTGFSLMGHGCEMARASGAALRVIAPALPLLPGALDYAARGITTGGAQRNREHFAPSVRIDPAISEPMTQLLWDPQTSGGLLMAAPPDAAPALQARFAEADAPLWAIGEVIDGEGVEVAG
ncbi:MAG TPA: selenide, water dikinase SelD [Dehalococcoidia bacterium]|jgi:selenide,water dikinase|nr:selenide, water dikinase SelD [Dehalococcoidia bacterium]